jgi:hypothetical protein
MIFRFTIGESSWTLDMHEIRADDAIELRKLTGVKWPLLVVGFNTDEPIGVKAFVWLARKMSGDPVPFDSEEMNYRIVDLRIEKVTADGEPEPDPAPAGEAVPALAGEVEPPDPTSRPSAKQPRRKPKTSGTRSRG